MLRILTASFVLVAIGCNQSPVEADKKTGILPPDAANASGFAVVELFTSEGCSSCPSADDVINDIAAELKKSKNSTPVYLLAFHVDYWDRLGWKDRFADKQYTQRQRDYAKHMRLRSIYTPQTIVNGTMQFVGSDRSKTTNAIAQALTQKPSITLVTNVEKRQASSNRWTITVEGATDEVWIHVAKVQSGLASKVTAGENRGRTLHHMNVVRSFKTHILKSNKAFAITTSNSPDEKNIEWIALVQDIRSRKYLAAKRLTQD